VEQTVRNRTESHSEEGYKGSSAAVCTASLGSALPRRCGFTHVEVVVASERDLVVLGGLFSLISYTHFASASVETLNSAKNIAAYSLEYLRARNVVSNPEAPRPGDLVGGQSFYDSSTHQLLCPLPGLIDLKGRPLAINSIPRYPDGTTEGGGVATLSTVQGWVSLRDGVAVDPWETNATLESLGVGQYLYRDMITSDPFVIRFGTVNAELSPASAIRSFSSRGEYRKADGGGGYLPTIWGASSDPHFTTQASRNAACHSYLGYRVLTQITAYSNDLEYQHVQYYDVQIVVYWMISGKERSYATRTTIATY
jgi:hypothetical protein